MNANKGLCVCYGGAEVSSRSHLDDGGDGWRVLVVRSDRALPFKFAREKDAVVAMQSVADLLDWTMDYEDLVAALEPLKHTLRRLMTENLQW